MADVYLAPGHGRRPDGRLDPGADGGGTDEQEAGDRIARQVEDILTGAGLTVVRQPKGGPNFVGYPLTSITCWRVTAPASAQADEPSRMKE